MGSSTQQQQSSSSSSPWGPQAGALTSAFNGASNAYGQASTAQAPTNFTAQFTPDQLNTFQQMLGYTNGNTTPQTTSATGTTMQNAGSAATTGALSGLSSYDPTQLNNTGSLVDQANAYVNGQNIPAQVAQAMQSADETARDVTMPQIDQNAAQTGNTNSSRTGIADGLVQRGLSETAANMTGALGSQAFANGMNLASSNANANNTNELGALTNTANAGTNATNSGVNAGTTAINNQGTLYSMAQNAGQGEQAANQANLTNEQQQYQAQTQDPFAALQQYMGIVGSQNWGSNSTSNSTSTSTPSAWQVIGGLLGGAGSLAGTAGGLGWKPFG
ncbi:MAG: hypothetical protein ACHP7H_00340 [Hyphomicrobiales bacterium]